MPYSISTKDGIVINNIPDDVDRNSDALKEKVASTRAQRAQDEAVSEEVAEMREGGSLERFGEGVSASVGTAARGVKGLFTDLSPEDKRQIATNKAFLEGEKGEGIRAENLGGFAADVASFIVPGGGALKVARGIPLAMKLASKAPLLAPLAGEAALGAGLSAAYAPEDRGTAAAFGGVGGAAGYGIGRGVSRLAGGLVKPSAQAKALQGKGVEDLTIGQAADQGTLGGKMIRRAEESLQSLPIAGRAISKARERANDSFGKIAINRAVPPGGKPLEGPSREAFKSLKGDFDNAYSVLDDLNLPAVQYFATAPYKAGFNIEKEISSIINNSEEMLPSNVKSEILSFINKGLYKKFGLEKVSAKSDQFSLKGGKFSEPQRTILKNVKGKDFKEFQSDLNTKIRDLHLQRQSRTSDDNAKLGAYKQIDQVLTEFLRRNVPKDIAKQLKETDAAYANYKTLERASAYIGATEGKFTPAQLKRAVAAVTPKSRYTSKQGLLQDLTDPADTVLKPTMPDSGTAERAYGLGVGIGAVTNPVPTLGAIAGTTLGASGLYSRPVQKFLLGGGSKQQAAAEALRRASPYFGLTGAYAGSELGQ